MTSINTDIPPGFEPHFRQSPLTDPWEPLYSKRTDKAVIIGLRLAKPHTNARGLIHGGLIAALLVVKRISLTVASLGLLRIHTTSGRSLRSKPVSRKSPAKRPDPMQPAVAQMTPVCTPVSTTVVVQCGFAASASTVSE